MSYVFACKQLRPKGMWMNAVKLMQKTDFSIQITFQGQVFWGHWKADKLLLPYANIGHRCKGSKDMHPK